MPFHAVASDRVQGSFDCIAASLLRSSHSAQDDIVICSLPGSVATQGAGRAAALFATAIDADAVWCAIARAGHLAPGLAVDFADGAARALREKIELAMKCSDGDGNHVP